MRLCFSMAAYFLLGYPCFFSCLTLLRRDRAEEERRQTPLWAGGCALLFSVVAGGMGLLFHSFFACLIALLLSGAVMIRLCRESFSLTMLPLLSCYLLTVLLELLVWLGIRAICRESGGLSLHIGILLPLSVLLTLLALGLGQKRVRPLAPSDFTTLSSVLCSILFFFTLLLAKQLQHSAYIFRHFLLPLLLLSVLVCSSGLQNLLQQRRLKQELAQKAEEVRRLQAELHDYRNLVMANQSRVEDMAARVNRFLQAQDNFSTEFAAEIDTLRETTSELYRLTGKRAREDLLSSQALPKCGFPLLDQLLDNCLSICAENGIYFNLSVISPFEKHSRPPELEEAFLAASIAEHVLDAVRAILRSGREDGEIDMVMGLLPSDDGEGLYYGVDILDNGEPFSLEILSRLGEEDGVTTGGTGIGFPTTLKRLALCNGSLVVRDLSPEGSDSMTSCVSLQFDGKRKFLVLSDYRQEEIDALRQIKRADNLSLFDFSS